MSVHSTPEPEMTIPNPCRHEWERGSAANDRLLLICAACGARLHETEPESDWKKAFNSSCSGRPTPSR